MRTLSLVLFLAATGCSAVPQAFAPNAMAIQAQSAARPVVTIDVTEAYQWITSDPNFMILDLRTPEEYAQGHIAKSRLLNFYDSSFKTQLETMDRNQPYIIYCRSGARSGEAMKTMQEMGFRKVFNIKGGTLAWQAKGYPLVR
jgi:rhodanese-related sulfurtransferase